jgi:hypothetical protein
MKIILSAFNKMYSAPMDVPEDTGTRWKMALTQPLQVISGYSGQKIGELPPMPTICEFEWTGKMDMETGARHYVLAGISKR